MSRVTQYISLHLFQAASDGFFNVGLLLVINNFMMHFIDMDMVIVIVVVVVVNHVPVIVVIVVNDI